MIKRIISIAIIFMLKTTIIADTISKVDKKYIRHIIRWGDIGEILAIGALKDLKQDRKATEKAILEVFEEYDNTPWVLNHRELSNLIHISAILHIKEARKYIEKIMFTRAYRFILHRCLFFLREIIRVYKIKDDKHLKEILKMFLKRLESDPELNNRNYDKSEILELKRFTLILPMRLGDEYSRDELRKIVIENIKNKEINWEDIIEFLKIRDKDKVEFLIKVLFTNNGYRVGFKKELALQLYRYGYKESKRWMEEMYLSEDIHKRIVGSICLLNIGDRRGLDRSIELLDKKELSKGKKDGYSGSIG